MKELIERLRDVLSKTPLSDRNEAADTIERLSAELAEAKRNRDRFEVMFGSVNDDLSKVEAELAALKQASEPVAWKEDCQVVFFVPSGTPPWAMDLPNLLYTHPQPDAKDAARLDWIAMYGSFGVDSVTGDPGGNGQKRVAATRANIDAAMQKGGV